MTKCLEINTNYCALNNGSLVIIGISEGGGGFDTTSLSAELVLFIYLFIGIEIRSLS